MGRTLKNSLRILSLQLLVLGSVSAAIAAPGDGTEVFLTDNIAGRVVCFDVATGQLERYMANGFFPSAGPAGMALDFDGNLYIADEGSGKILRFDAVTGQYKGAFGSGFLTRPYGINYRIDGNLYVSDLTNDSVTRFDAATGQYEGTFGTGFVNTPAGMDFDTAQNILFVVSASTGVIVKFNPLTGQYLGTMGNGFLSSGGITCAMDSSGDLLVNDFSRVVRFNPTTGQYKGIFASGFLGGAYGMTVDSTSKVQLSTSVSSASDMVLRFTPDTGQYQGNYGTGFFDATLSNLFQPRLLTVNTVFTDCDVSTYPTSMQVEIRAAGSTTPVATKTVSMVNGTFKLLVPPMNFDISVFPTHYLRKTVNIESRFSNPVVNLNLVNGDGEHDNIVDLGDFDRFALAFGSSFGDANYDSQVDFNCDLVIDLGDFDILALNFGSEGDN